MQVDWSAVAREVTTTMRRRRVPTHRAEEIAQTALERAVVAATPAWSTRDAVRWSVRVAVNLSIDDRRRSTAMPMDELPDHAGVDDVERQVLGRLELERVASKLPLLSDDDRQLVLGAGGRVVDDRERRRLKVARHRARARLRMLVDGAGAWLLARPAVRRFAEHESPGLREVAAAVAVAAVVASPPPGGVVDGVRPLIEQRVALELVADVLPRPVASLAAESDQSSLGPSSDVSTGEDDVRPDWVDPDGGARVADVPRPDDPDRYLWYWNDDPELDEDPLVCAWHRSTRTEVCSPVTWGDVREVSPVPIGDTPT